MFKNQLHTFLTHGLKGRVVIPKRMNFRKSSEQKIMLRMFSEIHERSTLYNGKNMQHKFWIGNAVA